MKTLTSSSQNQGHSVSGGASSNSGSISQSSSSGSFSAQGGASGAQAATFPEPVIRRLVEKGYNRHDVLEALTNASGNEEKAAIALFAKSLKF